MTRPPAFLKKACLLYELGFILPLFFLLAGSPFDDLLLVWLNLLTRMLQVQLKKSWLYLCLRDIHFCFVEVGPDFLSVNCHLVPEEAGGEPIHSCNAFHPSNLIQEHTTRSFCSGSKSPDNVQTLSYGRSQNAIKFIRKIFIATEYDKLYRILS